MAITGRHLHGPLAGRVAEVDEAVRSIRSAADGTAAAVLVTGEAGIGKTSLVSAAVDAVEGEVDLLWAQCLPLTSLNVPFLPLRTALRGWSGGRDLPPPAIGDHQADGGGDALLAVDGWLTAVSRRRPVVLVVDDLHWADQSSLDVLLYVLAGRPDRHLAVLLTQRTEDTEAGPALRRWLADVRRLPVLRSLPLGRLDRPATADQLARLLGRVPHQSLVDDVFVRAHGNPYLTTLLTAGLHPDAEHPDQDLPTELREALVRSWQGLSAPAKATTRLLAVAGRPSTAAVLAEVAVVTGSGSDPLPALREAAEARVVEPVGADAYWFVHPLLAEVLEAGLLPEDRRRLHSAYAAVGERRLTDPRAAIDVADHHWSAGNDAAAFNWALAGADAAVRMGGAAEALRLLRRALDLRPKADEPPPRRQLLDRIRVTAERAGEQEEELSAIEDLLDDVDRDAEPLVVAELLVRRTILRMSTGREFYPLDALRDAVALSAVDPGSGTHALALAELADAEVWHGAPEAAQHAEEAVRLARWSGSSRALSYALTARVMVAVAAGTSDVLDDARESQAAAATAGDGFGFVHATLWGANSVDNWTTPSWLEFAARGRTLLETLDVPSIYHSWLAINEAGGRLLLGDWRGCAALLRTGMVSSPGPMGDISARLTAALLACWQGRQDEAEQHLARADELNPDGSAFAMYPFDAMRAELAVARGDADAAVFAAMRGVHRTGETPTGSERLVPLAARALADAVQRRLDAGASSDDLRQALTELRLEFAEVVADGPADQPVYATQLAAMQAWYDAELVRGLGGPDAAAAWARAADAFAAGGLRWDEAYAAHRHAEALLHAGAGRDEVAVPLRRAHRLADELQALPRLAEVEALARAARIPLAEPAPVPDDATTAALGHLTAREREVLSHVVAGRTYAEIARDLVISEKTVSVHVSNLLRKTGATNRVELARRAQRLAGAG